MIIIKRKLILLLNLITIGFIFFFVLPISKIQAANQQYIDGTNGVLSSKTDEEGKVPNGLKDLSKWFIAPSFDGGNGTNTNTGKILSPGEDVNGTRQSVVRISQYNSFNAYGAVWSRRDQTDPTDRNYIDVNKKQTVSMWIFVGGGPSISQNQNTGEGMTFVLQNSDDGASAYNNSLKTVSDTSNHSGVGGESMGVWGAPIDKSGYDNSSSVLAKRAIQNSWALEFDTRINSPSIDENGSLITDSFDRGVYAPSGANGLNHIASGFPANPATYTISQSGGKTYYQMTHSNLLQYQNGSSKQNFLTDGEWHHLTLIWLPAHNSTNKSDNPEIVYTFNDKKIDGSAQTGTTQTVPIVDKTALGTPITNPFNFKNVNATDNKLYWGFTGATGDATHNENNLIIMESIPSIAEGHVTATIHDNTANRDVATSYDDTYTGDKPTPSDQDLSVNNKDSLSVKYKLYYDSGLKTWNNIAANINLPAHINYTNATISYNDSKTPDETIALTGSQTNMTHTLAKALDSTNNTSATISVNGTADGGDATTTTVDPANATFDSPNLFKNIDTPTFKIIQPKTLTLTALASNVDNQNINLSDNVKFGGTVAYKPTATIDTTKIMIHRVINGVENPSTAVALSTLNQTSSADVFNYTTNASDLKEGSNTISFYAEDDYHNISPKITYTVNVVGDLIIDAASKSSFQTVQAFPTKRVIHRSNDWDVHITDNQSKNTSWTLQAKATPLINGSTTWDNGGIVFVDTKNNRIPITNTNVNIANGTKTLDGQQNFNISSNWTKENGILLDQTGYEPKGVYTTTVTWSAIDGIHNIG